MHGIDTMRTFTPPAESSLSASRQMPTSLPLDMSMTSGVPLQSFKIYPPLSAPCLEDSPCATSFCLLVTIAVGDWAVRARANAAAVSVPSHGL